MAANIDKLGARGLLLGVVGDDGFAAEIVRLKPEGNLVIRDAACQTIVKTRVISQRQQIVRIDREARIRLSADVLERIRAAHRRRRASTASSSPITPRARSIPTVMALLKDRAVAGGIPIVVDPKPPHFDLYRDVTGITPNLKEAEEMTGTAIANDADVALAPEPHPPQIQDPLHPDHPGQPGDLGRGEEPEDVPPAGLQP